MVQPAARPYSLHRQAWAPPSTCPLHTSLAELFPTRFVRTATRMGTEVTRTGQYHSTTRGAPRWLLYGGSLHEVVTDIFYADIHGFYGISKASRRVSMASLSWCAHHSNCTILYDVVAAFKGLSACQHGVPTSTSIETLDGVAMSKCPPKIRSTLDSTSALHAGRSTEVAPRGLLHEGCSTGAAPRGSLYAGCSTGGRKSL